MFKLAKLEEFALVGAVTLGVLGVIMLGLVAGAAFSTQSLALLIAGGLVALGVIYAIFDNPSMHESADIYYPKP